MLSASVLQVGDGEQSFSVPGWRAPVIWPTYWVKLFCVGSVSVHSRNQPHCDPSAWRYGIAAPNPRPTSLQRRFSKLKTMTES